MMDLIHTEALIEQARKGDGTAQGRLVSICYKRIYNFAFKFFADHDLAMEVSQKTFIAMCRNISKLKNPGSFRPWLYTIASNLCREELRKNRSGRTRSIEEVLAESAEKNTNNWEVSLHRHTDPEKKIYQQELTKILQLALMELTEEQRKILIMKEYEGLKFREIAEVLGISENTAKSRLYYALVNMRKILKRLNINKETFGYEI